MCMNVSFYMYVYGSVQTLCPKRPEEGMESGLIESVVGARPGFSVGAAYDLQKVHSKPQRR